MPGQENKSVIHPIAIFKQAWETGWLNLGKLGAIYLIFNLPITLISLSPLVRSFAEQKPNLVVALWYLSVIAISSWGHIALLLGVSQILNSGHCLIGQNINQAKTYLGKYLALVWGMALLFVGAVVLFSIITAVLGAFLPKNSNMLAAAIFLVLAIALIVLLVFFGLRWSLAAPVCVFENTWPIAALQKSLGLVKNQINSVVGIYLLVGLAYLVGLLPMFIARMLAGAGAQVNAPAQIGSTVYLVLLNIMLVPFTAAIAVILYKKLKEV